jgi:hypothetical protein
MIKLYVVFVGLFALVAPEDEANGVYALLLRTGGISTSNHVQIPVHMPRIAFNPRGLREGEKSILWNFDSAEVRWQLSGEDVRFAGGGYGSGPFKKENWDSFANLERVLGSKERSKIKKSCAASKPTQECLSADGRPLIIGRVFLSGGVVKPIEVELSGDGLRTVSSAVRREIWGFQSLLAPERFSRHIQPASNAALFETDISGDVSIEISGERIPLEVEKVDKCQAISGTKEECVIVWVENVFEASGDEDEPGAASGAALHGTIDQHFEIFYDLLEKPEVRLVPYLKVRDVNNSDPPGNRCIPPVFTSN